VGNRKTRNVPDTLTLLWRTTLSHSGLTCFSVYMLPFDSHGVTYPTLEQKAPGPAGLREEQNALADPESAAGSLDEVELD
jgi:hypothetical protein